MAKKRGKIRQEAMRSPLRLAPFGKDEPDTTWVRNSCEELEEFFIDYHKMSGKKYRVLDVRGPSEALRRIQDGVKAAR